MKPIIRYAGLIACAGILLPVLASAQTTGASETIKGLQGTLNTVFNAMLANCGELTGVGRGLAGFGALWYIAYRVWGHLARAESIDFFPLLRPFAIGLALLVYPSLINDFNAILQPTADGTAALVDNSNAAISSLLAQKQALLQQGAEWQMYVGTGGDGDMSKWAQYTGNTDNGISTGFGLTNWAKFEMSKASYNMKNSFKMILSEVLEVIFEAAALCVNTARIFFLVVMAIVGPLCLGLSVFNGLHHVLTAWFAKYIHYFLWLPVCNIFGSIIGQIQVEMLKIDISQLQTSGATSFGATDATYLVFLLMGIIGYTCVPSVTQNIITVFPSGGPLLSKISNSARETVTAPIEAASSAGKAIMAGAL